MNYCIMTLRPKTPPTPMELFQLHNRNGPKGLRFGYTTRVLGVPVTGQRDAVSSILYPRCLVHPKRSPLGHLRVHPTPLLYTSNKVPLARCKVMQLGQSPIGVGRNAFASSDAPKLRSPMLTRPAPTTPPSSVAGNFHRRHVRGRQAPARRDRHDQGAVREEGRSQRGRGGHRIHR